jgi:hypothetical protein
MHEILRGMVIGAAATLLVEHGAPAFAASCGDSDNSGAVAINDVVLHLRVVSGIDAAASICGNAGYANCANLNGDGAGPTDISDTVLLLRQASNVANCPSDQCLARTVLAGCPGTAALPSNITGNLVIPAGCDARVNGVTNVAAGAVLTVEPGATVKGNAGLTPPSVLVVRPGGRINAVGTAGQPITWTSSNALGARAAEDWGGVALLGNAPVNEPGISIEGLNDGFFGGTKVDDFSGCMSYNRIQFSGRELTPDNELNLFQMAGVGNRTQLDHIQAHIGADDGIEWFGGTVNMSYVVSSSAGDDNFDHQLGWTGGLQFGLIAQRAALVESGGSNGWEMDNSEFGADNLPRSAGKYCNVTAIGARYSGDNPGVTNQFGVFSRRGNAMTIANSIVKDFRNGGYQMRDATTAARACVNASTLNTTAPVGVIQNSLFTDNGATGTEQAVNHSSCDAPGECACTTTEHYALLQAQRNVLSTGDAAVEAIGGNTFPPNNLVPAPGSLPDTHPAADCTQINGSFVSAPYVGAFEPGGSDWTAGWTEYPLN